MRIFPDKYSIATKLSVIEIFIMLIGILISISGIVKVCAYDMSYLAYIIVSLIGLFIVFILIVGIIKKWIIVPYIGIFFIHVWAVTAGLMFCQVNATCLKQIEPYRDEEIRVMVDGEIYKWDQKSYDIDEGRYDMTEIGEIQSFNNEALDKNFSSTGLDTNFGVYKKDGDDNLYLYVYSDLFLILHKVSD